MKNEANLVRENIKKLKRLLTENVNSYDIVDAIKNHKVIYIYYAGDDTVMKGYRTIEPHVLGVSTAGNTVLRAWQQAGASDSNKGIGREKRIGKDDMPGWRLFNVEFITAMHDTGKRFSTENGKVRPKYNPNDKQMSSIIISAQIGADISDFGVGTNKSFDDVVGDKSVFDKQASGFKDFSDISQKDMLLKNTVFNLYEFISRYRKKNPEKYIIVKKNGRIWFDLEKNRNKYNDNDVYGNLKELYQKYSGNKTGSKKFFDEMRRKYLNNT